MDPFWPGSRRRACNAWVVSLAPVPGSTSGIFRRFAISGKLNSSYTVRHMKIFISHSGDRSRELAEHVVSFIKQMIQATDPWISTGMDKGLKWLPEISSNLEASGLGIVCLTKENLPAPWILFESGALAKRLNDKVCPLLLDVDPNDVGLPLSQFQNAKADDAEEVWKLVATIAKEVRAAGSNPPSDSDLRKMFDEYHWKKFSEQVEKLKAKAPSAAPPKRSVDDMVAEVLTTIRGFSRQSEVDSAVPELVSTIRDIAYHTSALYEELEKDWRRKVRYSEDLDRELRALEELTRPATDAGQSPIAELHAMIEARRRRLLVEPDETTLGDIRSSPEFKRALGIDQPKATEKDS
jgi:hypothetical protein